MWQLRVQLLGPVLIQGQQLACRDWHGVNRTEALLMEEGEEVGDGRAEGSSATGDGGQAAVSLMPDVDGTRSGSLLEPDFQLVPVSL